MMLRIVAGLTSRPELLGQRAAADRFAVADVLGDQGAQQASRARVEGRAHLS